MPQFILSVTEYNTYTTTIEAEDEQAARDKAQTIWSYEGPDALNWRKGTLEEWECYQVE
jgi:hypothetical protein